MSINSQLRHNCAKGECHDTRNPTHHVRTNRVHYFKNYRLSLKNRRILAAHNQLRWNAICFATALSAANYPACRGTGWPDIQPIIVIPLFQFFGTDNFLACPIGAGGSQRSQFLYIGARYFLPGSFMPSCTLPTCEGRSGRAPPTATASCG